MNRKIALLLVGLALVAAPAAHAAGWTIGVNGGLAKPTGDFGKDLNMGPGAGLDICMHINDQFAVGAEGNWTTSKHKDVGVTEDLGGGDSYTLDKANFSILSGGVHGKYFVPVGEGGKVTPFLLAGVGMYNAKDDYQETIVLGGTTFVNTDESDGVKSESRFGYKVGAGGTYKATEQVGISLQGDYNIVTLDTAGAPAGTPSTFNFFTVRVGVNYHIMSK